MSGSSPICTPSPPVMPARVSVTSSTGARGWSASSRPRMTKEARCQLSAPPLKWTVRRQGSAPERTHSRSALPARRPSIRGRE